MENVFQTINCITQTKEIAKAYHEPKFESVPQVPKERVYEVSFSRCTEPNSPVKAYSNSPHNTHYSANFRSGSKQHSSQFLKEQGKQQYNHRQGKLEYYCYKRDHLIRDCMKFSKDKTRYNLKTTDLARKYEDKLRQAVRKGITTVNEAAFSNTQELTYSMEQVEQLLGSLNFSNSESDSLDRYIMQVTIDDVSSDNVILYTVRVKCLEVDALYDTDASISIMSK